MEVNGERKRAYGTSLGCSEWLSCKIRTGSEYQWPMESKSLDGRFALILDIPNVRLFAIKLEPKDEG